MKIKSRFELSFVNISQLEKKLKFCETNDINKINIPCKGVIKKNFYIETVEYINKHHQNLDVVYHYSLYHQYSKNRNNSYLDFLDFINNYAYHKNIKVLLISGSNKKTNFDVIDVLHNLKNERNLDIDLGVAYNPYLGRYYNIFEERQRYEKKISSSFIKSVWLQFGTDIKLLKKEFEFIKNIKKRQKYNFFGSLLIPSKQFLARFKFRPWKGVYIADKYQNSLEDFYCFTRDLIDFYIANNITPVIETDFYSSEKLNVIETLFNR